MDKEDFRKAFELGYNCRQEEKDYDPMAYYKPKGKAKPSGEEFSLRTETIIDIIEKIPKDKIEECMEDLTLLVKDAHTIEKDMDYNKKISWKDDGKREGKALEE